MANYSHAYSAVSTDSLSSLFEPDAVLPSQFLANDEEGVDGGERKLMAALLSDGIEAYIASANSSPTDSQGKAEHAEAREWVDTKDYGYVFSFDVVCESLGIDPDYLRLGLARYVEAIREQKKVGSTAASAWKKIRRPRKH